MTVPPAARRAQLARTGRERDPHYALDIVTTELQGIDSHPEAGFLENGNDLHVIAFDILDRWQAEPDGYPGGLAGFICDYVIALEATAVPGQLAAAWQARVRDLGR